MQDIRGTRWQTSLQKREQQIAILRSATSESPKRAVKSELSEISETKWQIEWNRTTKGATTKLDCPKVAHRLKLKINVTPNLTMMVTGHSNIKS